MIQNQFLVHMDEKAKASRISTENVLNSQPPTGIPLVDFGAQSAKQHSFR
jgi:hypothetical protein